MKKIIYIVAILIFIISLFCFGYVFYWIIKYGGFPINFYGVESGGLPEGNFSNNERLVRTILWYSIVLGVLATIPIHIFKILENKKIYTYYIWFWILASFALSIITVQFGLLLAGTVLGLCNLFLTIIPAVYQNKKNRNIHD